MQAAFASHFGIIAEICLSKYGSPAEIHVKFFSATFPCNDAGLVNRLRNAQQKLAA
jgi:hypothetical protein